MTLKKSHLLIILLVILIIQSCARKGSIEGGPKDETPPVMILATPSQETINFNLEKIRLDFDEYIKLKDVNKQLVISPPMKNQPNIVPMGSASKFVTIGIIDTLLENTTYTLNFGNSIVDNNESNPLYGFKYVFSTGDYIDSLKISGTVTDGFNMEGDDDISILLYEVTDTYTDSIIYNERPSYVGNTIDSIGFEITNLKGGKYLMIALKDVSRNFKFDPKQDKIGFFPDFVTLPVDSTSTHKITLFKEISPYRLMRPSEVNKGHIYFGYEGAPEGLKINLLSDKPENYRSTLIPEIDKDSVSYWYTPMDVDSLNFEVIYKNVIDTVTVRIRSKEIDSLTIASGISGALKLRDTFYIKSNIPIFNVDESQISIMNKDSLNIDFTTSIDSSKKNLKILFDKEYNNRYKFTVLPNTIEDIFGNINDTLSFNASTKHPDDYGIINITLPTIENYPIILELTDNRYDLIERIYATEKQVYRFENLDPKEYSFRVIFDTNKNGKWDTGNFLNRTVPEKVVYFDSVIELRANWIQSETFTEENGVFKSNSK